MPRWRGSTTARGYGASHQQARRQALAQFTPGQPCARCGHPIQPGQPVDLGHQDGSGKQLYAGLEHRSCNRAAGARLKNRKRTGTMTPSTPPAWQPSRHW